VAGAAPVVMEAGGMLSTPAGDPLFPLDPARYQGETLAFLAGDPSAHKEALVSIAA